MITRLPSPHGRKCRGLALAFILSPCCFAALLGAEPEKPAFVLAGDTTGPGAGATASGGPEEKDGSGVSADADDSIVSMGAFKVGLGHYIEASSAASMKVEVPLMNLPFTVQGLNAAFLKDVNSSRLEDSFGYVVGLTKSGSTANSFSLRGFSAAGSNLQSVQIDGLPGLSSRFASPPTVAVERMEVLKGPTSVLYGQGNPGGLLNIVTKSPQGKSQTVLSGYVSSYAGRTSGLGDAVGWTASFDTTGPIAASKHWFFRVIGSYENKDSYRDYYYEHSTYLYPSLTYKWSSDTWLSLKMDYVREDRQANDGLVVPFLNIGLLPPINVTYTAPDAKDTDYGESLTALFQTRLLDVWTARVAYRATWHTDSRRAIEVIQGAIVSDPVDYRNSSITGRFKLQDNSRRYNFIDANVSGELGPKAFRHTLIAGVSGGKEWSDFYRVAQKPNYPGINLYRSAPDAPGNYPAIPPILPSYQPQDRKTTLWNYGAYASDKLTLGERWDATAGVRWDKQDAYQYEVITNRGIKSTTTCVLPSIGLLYHAARQVSVYANYCEGFKPQTSGNVDASDNPNFPSESSTQVELGVKVQALDERLTLALGAYDIRKRNVLSATGQTAPSGNPIANLSGLQESTGVEFDTTYQPWPNWEIRVGATYIDARVKKSTTASIVGAQLDNSPHASGNFWTRYNFSRGALRGLGFGIGAIYVGQRQGIITNVPAARLEAPSYARLDVGVYYGKGRYNYALNVGNITDRLYVAAIQQGDATRINPGDPRKITFSVKTQF